MSPATITSQPVASNQMNSFPVPSGLESMMDKTELFIIKQRVGWFTGRVKYSVFDNTGKQIFTVVEDTKQGRTCCGLLRTCNMIISDMQGQEVMHLVKPFNCCTRELEVTGSDSQTVMGSITEQWTWTSCSSKFLIKNEFGDTVLTLGKNGCCGDIDFTFSSLLTGHWTRGIY